MAEFIIVFREVLEGSLIVGILYTYLDKIGQVSAIKKLWQGVIVAIVASILGSFLFQIFADGFSGKSAKIFEGIVMIVASGVLGTMIIWMAKNRNISEELKGKADKALNTENLGYGIFALSFISVFREGVETILFLYGVMIKQGGLNIFLSLIGAVLGISVSILVFVRGKKVPLKTFFNVTSILLIFVAAGMFAYGIHELESGGVIKDYGRIWDINPPKLSDGTYPMFHDKGLIGGLLKGLLGYNGNPSLIELIAWLLSLCILGFTWKKVAA